MRSTLKTMPTSSLRSAAAAAGLVALLLAGCGGTAKTEDPLAAGPSLSDCLAQDTTFVKNGIDGADLDAGGQLYDNWIEAKGANTPSGNQPLWADRPDQVTNKTTGAGTWRCKECHGWDYKGASGNYGPGSSKYTGFPGILTAAQRDGATAPANLYCAIKAGIASTNGKHSFASLLTNDEILNLTKFIAHGGVKDTSALITSTGGTNGDVAAGATKYASSCALSTCHDTTGLPNTNNEGLGLIATENPWEMFHKVRFGVAENKRAIMPPMESLLLETDIINIIAYAQQSLSGGNGAIKPGPTGGGGGGGGGGGTGSRTGVILGGLLYDNHWDITGKTTTTDNPMWVLRKADPISGGMNSSTTTDTWRCKECHGWDYKGEEGAYGPGRSAGHYTGFPSLWARKDKFTDRQALIDYLTNGVVVSINNVPTRVHNFGTGAPQLSAAQISALVDFLMGPTGSPASAGLIDTAPYILEGSLAGGAVGDAAKGATLYASGATSVLNCANASCHGPDGKGIDFADDNPATPPNEFLGDLAKSNPWEVLHKARFGTPDALEMPAVLMWGTTKDASDITSFTQKTLP